MKNRELMKIEVGDKSYLLGFPTRTDALNAENNGLDIAGGINKVLTLTSKLFYTGLLAKQPNTTEEEAMDLLDAYVDEGGDTEEITAFLANQITGFTKSPDGKTKKKAKIITI